MGQTVGEEIELKFEGAPIAKLGGAPAEAIINSLSAVQRLVHLIGMKAEGHAFGQRTKPSAKVRREYAVVCRAPQLGSHIQPFVIANQSGVFTAGAISARSQLLRALEAFDSGDSAKVEYEIPDARERWFMANAAAGLLPDAESGIDVTVRDGPIGPFSFKAGRARDNIERFRSGSSPEPSRSLVVGELEAVDFAKTIVTVKPMHGPSVKCSYPLSLESMLKANARRRVSLHGDPLLNTSGDISGFKNIVRLMEIDPSMEPLTSFESGGNRVMTSLPLALPLSFDFDNSIFQMQESSLGIDIMVENYENIRAELVEELDMVWRNYALAPDAELDIDAIEVKKALRQRFRKVEQ